MNYLQRLSPSAQGSIDSKEEKSNESLPRIVDTRKQFDSSISPGNLRLQQKNRSQQMKQGQSKSVLAGKRHSAVEPRNKDIREVVKIPAPENDRNKFIV